MPNRFNTILDNQGYVNQHIPLPLDLIASQGAAKQKDLDTHKKALASDTDEFGKLNLQSGLMHYGDKGVTNTDLGLDAVKQSQLKGIQAEREQLVTDLQSGKISDDEFKQKSYQHIQKAKLAYDNLSGQSELVKKVNTANETTFKDKDFGTRQYLGTDYLAYNRDYMEDAAKGIYRAYNPPAISKPMNMQEAAIKFKFAPEGGEKVSIGDYITNDTWKGTTQERAANAADLVWADAGSDPRIDAELQLKHLVRSNPGIDLKTKSPIIVGYNKDKTPIYENMTFDQEFMYEKQKEWRDNVITQNAGIVTGKKVKADPYNFADTQRKKDEEQAVPLTTTSESDTYQGIIEDPRFSKYITTNAQGVKEVDWKGLKTAAVNGTDPSTWEEMKTGMLNSFLNFTSLGFHNNATIKEAHYKEGMNASTFLNQIEGLMKSKAAISGYKGEVKPENYNEILNQSKEFEQLRGVALDATGDVADIQSEELNKSKAAFTFLDPVSGNPITKGTEAYESIHGVNDKGQPTSNFRVLKRESRPVEGKGQESVLKVVDTKTNQTYYVREPYKETTTFYDALANVNNSGIEYITNGGKTVVDKGLKTSFDTKRIVGIQEDLDAAYIKAGGDAATKPKIAAISKDPNGHIAITMANPNNAQEQWIQQYHDVKGELKPMMFQTENGMEDHLPLNRYMSYKDRIYKTSVYGGALRKANKGYKPTDYRPIEETEATETPE